MLREAEDLEHGAPDVDALVVSTPHSQQRSVRIDDELLRQLDRPTLTPCMGGWCAVRDRCTRYLAGHVGGPRPVERLCVPGTDGFAYGRRVPIMQATWIVTQATRVSRQQHG